MVHKILQTSTSAISPYKLAHFTNYLAANTESLFNEERINALIAVTKYLQTVPVAKLSSSNIAIGKKSPLSVTVSSITGEKIEGLTVKASLHQKSNAVLENINLKYENGVASGEFDSSKLKAGYYTLTLEFTLGTSTYTLRFPVLLQGTVSISSLRYDITKSSSAPEGVLD